MTGSARVVLIVFLAMTASTALSADDFPGVPSAVLDVLIERRDAAIEAYNGGDIEAFVANYTADAWHISPRRPPVQGREALAAYFAPAMKLYLMRTEVRLLDAELEGDTATLISETTLTGEPRPGVSRDGGGPPEFTERRLNLTIFRRQPDGRWLIHRYVDTQPAEPAAAPATENR